MQIRESASKWIILFIGFILVGTLAAGVSWQIATMKFVAEADRHAITVLRVENQRLNNSISDTQAALDKFQSQLSAERKANTALTHEVDKSHEQIVALKDQLSTARMSSICQTVPITQTVNTESQASKASAPEYLLVGSFAVVLCVAGSAIWVVCLHRRSKHLHSQIEILRQTLATKNFRINQQREHHQSAIYAEHQSVRRLEQELRLGKQTRTQTTVHQNPVCTVPNKPEPTIQPHQNGYMSQLNGKSHS